jgi:hypothetical protein
METITYFGFDYHCFFDPTMFEGLEVIVAFDILKRFQSSMLI